MRRTFAFILTTTSLLAIACSGSAPTSPSRATAAAPQAAIAQSTPMALFGASVVDFARCLQSASVSGCFTARRVTPRDAGDAASPDAPSGLTAAADGSTVTLTWLAPTGTQPASAYIIEAGSASGLADLASISTNSTATTFTAVGVGAGTYYVRVRAQNSGGVSGASNEAILNVGGGGCQAAPGAPTGLFNAVSGSTVTLTWNAPAGGCAPSAYILQAGSAAGASDLANANVGAVTAYVASGVGAGTYFVRVVALNAYGQSAASNEVVVTVGGTPPPSSVTGRWVGLAPDGVIFNVPAAPDTFCDDADDLQLDLTQVGTALSGTSTLRTRAARTPPNCRSGDTPAGTATLTNGTADGTGISFRLGSDRRSLTFTGVVSGNRMSGVVICGGDQSQCGTFAATRQ